MEDKFAPYVAALGRGPGRSRDLTQEEARTAFGLILEGAADRAQIGAFLMLLRYRGENPATIAGLVQAARDHIGLPLPGLAADLDWPSYGAGRTREAPWFLLAALALAASGVAICMHGSNEFGAGQSVPEALQVLEIAPARNAVEAAEQLRARRFAYLPLAAFAPKLDELLGLCRLFGLRSPVNTLVRLLDPADAGASVDGVFHPPYIETHLAVAPMLNQARLLVLKGGGGEAERNPAKPVTVHLWDAAGGRSEELLPALTAAAHPDPEPDMAALWSGEAHSPAIEARIIGTVALGLIALQRGGDVEANTLWQNRRPIR